MKSSRCLRFHPENASSLWLSATPVVYTPDAAEIHSPARYLCMEKVRGVKCRLVDGDLNITQSNTIMRYIGSKSGLYGTSEADRALIDMVLDGISALRSQYLGLVYQQQMVRLSISVLLSTDELISQYPYTSKDVWGLWRASHAAVAE
jgi:hypothetical protein